MVQFYDPTKFAGLAKILVRVKGKSAKAKAASEIRNTEYYQRYNVPFQQEHMHILAPDGSWQADSMYFPYKKGLRLILTLIDVVGRTRATPPTRPT